MAAVGIILLSCGVSCSHKYLVPCAARNMQSEHTAEWTRQPLPPAQSSYLFIPASWIIVQPPLGSEWAPLAFSPCWFVRAVFIDTTKVCCPLTHEASKPQNGGGGTDLWRSLLQPYCYGRVPQSSLLRAVFSQLLNYLQRQRPHKLSGQRVPVTDHPDGRKPKY